MIQVIQINPGDTYGECEFDIFNVGGTLAEFQRLVNGYIEQVQVNLAGCLAYVNEEGRLSHNALASHISAQGPICGPMVLCGDAPEGREGNVPEEAFADLLMIVEQNAA